MSYGYVHLIWIVNFNDGFTAASVPISAAEEIKSFIRGNAQNVDIINDAFITPLQKLAVGEAERLFNKQTCRCFSDLIFACNDRTIAPYNTEVTAERLVDKRYECGGDINFPDHCIPNGIAYGVIENDKIVSVAYAHKTGEYQDIVADIGVETSKDFRRKGYARECVNSVARHVINKGGESVYKCSPANTASIHTALSAGYKPYGKSLIFSVTPD